MHNALHNFVRPGFEPQLDPGTPAAILDELRAQNIRMIYFFTGGGPNDALRAVGFDGSIRDL